MSTSTITNKIESCLSHNEWSKARTLILGELRNEPDDHWLLTQLGVTFYEEKKYKAAIEKFLESFRLDSDCPLTLWNLAGALDSLGQSQKAINIYAQLLGSKITAADDPCWESSEWADSLKTDCLYRVGCCFAKLKQKKNAVACFREYITIQSETGKGIYSVDDAKKWISKLANSNKASGTSIGDIYRNLTQANVLKVAKRFTLKKKTTVKELLES